MNEIISENGKEEYGGSGGSQKGGGVGRHIENLFVALFFLLLTVIVSINLFKNYSESERHAKNEAKQYFESIYDSLCVPNGIESITVHSGGGSEQTVFKNVNETIFGDLKWKEFNPESTTESMANLYLGDWAMVRTKSGRTAIFFITEDGDMFLESSRIEVSCRGLVGWYRKNVNIASNG